MLKRIASQIALLLVVTFAVLAGSAATASAATGDGSGGAPADFYTAKFNAFNCTYYSTSYGGYYGPSTYWNCSGGVYVKAWGERRYGNKCVTKDGSGWGWYNAACWNI